MKTTSRKNKTYRKQATKRERKITLSIIFGIFALVMLLSLYSSLSLLITKNKEQGNQSIKQTSINIEDLSIYYISNENEKTAYLAIFQAVDSLLANQSKSIKDKAITDLHAMAHQENNDFSFNTPGNDSYKSSGLFQISRYYHPTITTEQQNDPYFSANWTLKRLLANNYPSNRSNAIMSHNGTPNIKATKHYLNDINNYINN